MALQEEMERQGNWLFRYRGVLPLFIFAIGTFLYVRTEFHPEYFFLEETQYEVYFEMLCFTISLLGLAIRVYTVGYAPRNTSGRNTREGQVADQLNTTGIYSVVRHPLYLGNFLMWLGPAMLPGQFWFVIAFCFFYWIYYERIMFAEEQFLRKKFGADYLDWAGKVPVFIPDFNKYIKPKLSFSWRKVIKQEKSGLLALFFIFFAFDIVGELIESETDFNYFIIVGFVFSLVYYLTIKILRKRTTLLDVKEQ